MHSLCFRTQTHPFLWIIHSTELKPVTILLHFGSVIQISIQKHQNQGTEIGLLIEFKQETQFQFFRTPRLLGCEAVVNS